MYDKIVAIISQEGENVPLQEHVMAVVSNCRCSSISCRFAAVLFISRHQIPEICKLHIGENDATLKRCLHCDSRRSQRNVTCSVGGNDALDLNFSKKIKAQLQSTTNA